MAGFIEQHAAPSAQALIVDPNRGSRSAFNRHRYDIGFQLTETLLDAPLDDGSPYRGHLLHYIRRSRLPA